MSADQKERDVYKKKDLTYRNAGALFIGIFHDLWIWFDIQLFKLAQ